MADGMNTIEAMRKYIGALPSMFASSPASRTIIKSAPSAASEADVGSDITYQYGVPPPYSKPILSQSGDSNPDAALVTRQTVNAIGNLGSQLGFFEQCGGYFTFDQSVCDSIGGYPRDAILSFYDSETNLFRRVRSLKDDNRWNFLTDGVDGEWWAYADDVGMLSMHVDYSHSKDIGGRLFTDTGVSEWVEVEENCVLNCAAAGVIQCDANSPLFRYNSDIGHYSSYVSRTSGSSYLDISGSGGGFKTFRIGSWGWGNHGWCYSTQTHFEYRLWITAQISSFGACLALGAGDKIRVRNECFQTPLDPNSDVFAQFPQGSYLRYIGQRYFPPRGVSDADFPRRYLVRNAMLSPMRFKKI